MQDVRHLVPQVLDVLPGIRQMRCMYILSRFLVGVFSLFSFCGGFVDVVDSYNLREFSAMGMVRLHKE